jgi:hypothetical protein
MHTCQLAHCLQLSSSEICSREGEAPALNIFHVDLIMKNAVGRARLLPSFFVGLPPNVHKQNHFRPLLVHGSWRPDKGSAGASPSRKPQAYVEKDV